MRKINILITLVLLAGSHNLCAQDSTAADYFKKGDYYYRNFDHAQAIVEFNKCLELDPKNLNALLSRGLCKNFTGDYPGAIADFTEVIAMQPDHKFAYQSRGSAYNKTKEFKLALDDFNKVLEIDPKDQEAFNNRGFAKKGMGDKEGACEDWNKSRKLGNEEAKVILKNNHCR